MLTIHAKPQRKRTCKQRPKLECFAGDAIRTALTDRLSDAQFAADFHDGGSYSTCVPQAEAYAATASDRQTGRLLALLATFRRSTTSETFILVEQATLPSTPDGGVLFRRLMAMTLLNVAGLHGMPAALAFRVPAGPLAETFLLLTRHFAGSVSYPPIAGEPIILGTARMARRIAHAVAPAIRYDVASSALPGASFAIDHVSDPRDLYGTGTAVSLTSTRPVKARDDLLLVIDLRSRTEAALIEDTRLAYRKL